MINHRRLVALLLTAAALTAGCYNAETLRREHTAAVEVVHTEEIDLGEFQVTLPHVVGDPSDSVINFHAFGHVASSDQKAFERILETRGPELRSRMLLSIRALAEADFEEPELTTLRTTIADAINGALEKQLVKKVGFYHFAFNPM